MYPADLKYTSDHEWIRVTGDQGQVGITDYAQKQLGDVVYVELPDVGRTVSRAEAIGTIESVKAVSEIFAPVSGEIVAVNAALKDSPETINADPHGTWMMTIRLADPAETTALLDSTQYADLVRQAS
jgi:glycine cleavage system H protein